MSELVQEVDPGDLRLPPRGASGLDPWKLHQQIRQCGESRDGMPPLLVCEDPDGSSGDHPPCHPRHPHRKASGRPDCPGRRDRPLQSDSGRLALRRGLLVSTRGIRADVFGALEELSGVIPAMRAGALMAAIGELCADLHGRGLWDAADDELVEAIGQFRRNYESAVIGQTKQRQG